MIADDSALLAALPEFGFGFVLVLARVAACVMLIPGLGEAEVPAPVRAGFAAVLAMLLLPVVQPLLPAPPGAPAGTLMLVGAETMVGLWLGWLARLVLLALPLAGQIAAAMLGLANILQPDPALGAQTTALARLFALAAPVLVLAAGLHALPLAALAGSYSVFPPGAALPGADAAEVVVGALAASFGFGLQLAAPFVLASLVWQVGLGVLARLVPQLQVYFAAMPGQILGGLLLLGLFAAAMLETWRAHAGDAFAALPGL
jgi:flagellar biosynthetic protein FliR